MCTYTIVYDTKGGGRAKDGWKFCPDSRVTGRRLSQPPIVENRLRETPVMGTRFLSVSGFKYRDDTRLTNTGVLSVELYN